jgi:hypothetical protein
MLVRKCIGVVAVAVALACPMILQAKVVFLATFDSDSGATVKDTYGASGTVIGKAATVDGKYGKAFSFDGATAIQFKKTDALSKIKEPMSAGAWVKPAALTDWTNIVEMDGPAGAWKLGFSNAAPVWTTYRVKDHTGKGPVALNEWSHITATYDAKVARLYVNGKLDSEIAGSGGIKVDVAEVPTLDIGWRSTSKASFFKGAMDEVFVADTVLTDAEVATVMKGLATTSTAVEARGKLATQWAAMKSTR